MPFHNVIRPAAIEMLTRVLNAHCAPFGIATEDGRLSVAESILRLYQFGIADEKELARLIETEDAPDVAQSWRRRGAAVTPDSRSGR